MNSGVFTAIVSRVVVPARFNEQHNLISGTDFSCACHSLSLSFNRTTQDLEKQLGFITGRRHIDEELPLGLEGRFLALGVNSLLILKVG